MLNPDGVIHGNYRCSLSGCDLNRRWKTPFKTLHPEIFYFKQMIYNFASSTKLALFCDLHGHSMKKNIFIYGCHDKQQPLACRELPFLMSKLYEPFSFNDCNFLVQKNKEGTARVALWEGLRIPNIFTLESSFCGPSYENIHFQQTDFEKMGSRMCQAFLIYFRAEKKEIQENEQQEENKNFKSIQNRLNTNSPYSPVCKTEQMYRGQKNSSNKNTANGSKTINESESLQNSSSVTPTKQLRSISLDDGISNKHQKHLEELRTHYLNELWTKSLNEIQKIGMDESDDSDSCPSEDNLDEKEINKIFDKTVQSQQKLMNSRKNQQQCTLRSQKKQNFLNSSSFLNNSVSQSPSPSSNPYNQSQSQNNDENSPHKKKEYGWNSYFGRGSNSLTNKKLSNSEEKLLAAQKLNRNSELNDSINHSSNRKNIQQSQVTLAAIKNKAFNFQCISPSIPTNKHSPDNRYDDFGSSSPKKVLFYQQTNSRQLPTLSKMTSSLMENENNIEKKRQKYLKQQKIDDSQPFIANTLSKQIKYLQPNQQILQQQQMQLQQQQNLHSKQKILNPQFVDIFQQEQQQKNISERQKNLRQQPQNQIQSNNLSSSPPQPLQQLQNGVQQQQQQQQQAAQQGGQTNAFTNYRQSPYKRKYHKNLNSTLYKQNYNKSAQYDQNQINQNMSSIMQHPDKNNLQQQYRNNLSHIEFRDESDDLGISLQQANQKMMLNQSMLPSLYTHESSDTKNQLTEMQQDFLNIDLYDQSSYQRVNHFNQIPNASPKNTLSAFNNQLKATQGSTISAVSNQIKKKLQKESAIYVHQEKLHNQSQQPFMLNHSVDESAASTMRYDSNKIQNSALQNALYSNQTSQNQINKQGGLQYQDYTKYKISKATLNNHSYSNTINNQAVSSQSYYENAPSQKLNDKQTLCSSSQDYHGKNESLINLTQDIPIKIKLNKNNFNTINQVSSVNINGGYPQGVAYILAEPQSQTTLDEVILNNSIINQRINYSVGPPSISENQMYPKNKGKKKAFEQMIKKDIQNQIFNQKSASINNTIIDQYNASSKQEMLGENALSNNIYSSHMLDQGSQTNQKICQVQLSKKYDFQLQNNSQTNILDNSQQGYQQQKDRSDKNNSSLNAYLNNIESNQQTLAPSKSIRSTSVAKQKKTVNLQNNPLSKDQNPINLKKIIFSSINDATNLKQQN